MEINIQATVGICSEYMPAEGVEKAEVSIVVSPLKVTAEEDGSKIRVVCGCNLWQSCHNVACWYSIASRQTKKVQPGKSTAP